jgi:hypothetical protein
VSQHVCPCVHRLNAASFGMYGGLSVSQHVYAYVHRWNAASFGMHGGLGVVLLSFACFERWHSAPCTIFASFFFFVGTNAMNAAVKVSQQHIFLCFELLPHDS